jgi:hypothetical protein
VVRRVEGRWLVERELGERSWELEVRKQRVRFLR